MANNFPLGRHFPNTVWIMPLRSEPPLELTGVPVGWEQPAAPMDTPSNTGQSQQERWELLPKHNYSPSQKTSTDQTPAPSPTPASVSSPQPPEPDPQYHQGQEGLPGDITQPVLLEGTVLQCFCRDLSVAAAAKLPEAAQPALELRLSSPEVSGKEKRPAFATWALLHHYPAPSRAIDMSLIWAPPNPSDDIFSDTQRVIFLSLSASSHIKRYWLLLPATTTF